MASSPNYDETKVPVYTPLDPLLRSDGSKVTSIGAWKTQRECIIKLLQENIYGVVPDAPQTCDYAVVRTDPKALNGLATRTELCLTVKSTENEKSLPVSIALYVPNDTRRKHATFAGLNLNGNHTVEGSFSYRWPLEEIIGAGYALATAWCADVDPDYFDQFHNGLHGLFPSLQDRPDNFATISAWAWGLNRILDVLQSLPEFFRVDATKLIAIGFSRLGKTALWSAALDERWAMVISIESGCGGAALSKRCFGETVRLINEAFPHWFCAGFKGFNDNEPKLPIDQHHLLTLIAPRPLYIASAEQDKWSDPRGEFLAAKLASPVYRLYGKQGIPEEKNNFTVSSPIRFTIGHHVREGKHEVTKYDWEQFIHFANLHFN